MAADWIQYIIADKTCIPPATPIRNHYAESIIYMPHSHMVCDHKQSAREVLDPENCKTREDYGMYAPIDVGEISGG